MHCTKPGDVNFINNGLLSAKYAGRWAGFRFLIPGSPNCSIPGDSFRLHVDRQLGLHQLLQAYDSTAAE